MMKPTILFCGYRDWSLKIYFFIKNKYKHKINFVIIKTQKEFNKKIKYINPALIFFVGWSWIVEKNIVNKYKCVCLHPSSLPKYRGGSPLQHQIINNEKESAVTFFVMNEFLDKGPIVWQGKFSLEGNLNEIYFRITQKGKKGIGSVYFLTNIPINSENAGRVTNTPRDAPSKVVMANPVNNPAPANTNGSMATATVANDKKMIMNAFLMRSLKL